MMSAENRRQIEKNQMELAEQARFGIFGGGITATVISAFALVFSGYSFYETVLRAPDLAVFVPPISAAPTRTVPITLSRSSPFR